jgi:carboxymethylenebutenolidase
LPVSAQTITTDTEGLDAGEVSIPTGTATFQLLRHAEGREIVSVVLVVQEIFGVHEHTRTSAAAS